MLLGGTVALSGENGTYEESSMYVSEFKHAEYSGKIWNDCVELDDELFLIDEGEGSLAINLEVFLLLIL